MPIDVFLPDTNNKMNFFKKKNWLNNNVYLFLGTFLHVLVNNSFFPPWMVLYISFSLNRSSYEILDIPAFYYFTGRDFADRMVLESCIPRKPLTMRFVWCITRLWAWKFLLFGVLDSVCVWLTWGSGYLLCWWTWGPRRWSLLAAGPPPVAEPHWQTTLSTWVRSVQS